MLPYDWEMGRNGGLPVQQWPGVQLLASNAAWPAGADGNGEQLYIARARHAGGLHPGKFRPDLGGALIPYGRVEVMVPEYWIMVTQGNWRPSAGKETLAFDFALSAIVSGYEADGTPLFVARAELPNDLGVHPGKTRFGFPGAYIGFGGKELPGVLPFDVLQDLNYQWVTPSDEASFGYTAVQGGWESNGEELFVARASFEGSLCLGKTGGNIAAGTADIPFGNAEQSVNNFAILFSDGEPIWEPASNGRVPDGAVVCGFEPSGEPLYVARVAYAGGLHPGKVRLGLGGAHIGYDGQEIMVPNYEVLVTSSFTGLAPTGY